MAARKTETLSVEHGALTLERTFDASPARVFEAWRDVKARERWSPPNAETIIVYERSEFREGGVDICRCGVAGDLKFRAEVHYFDIVPERRILFAESVSEGGKRVAAALITVEFEAKGARTRMNFTAQIAALDGADMIAGYQEGWNGAFDNLEVEVSQ